ncbi:MAG: SRPBCC family protein [Pyrinomonadaceae bacterium]
MHLTEINEMNEKQAKAMQNVGNTERIASAATGGALIAYGIKRFDLIGAVLAAAGTALAYRGATGLCSVYESLGIDTNSKTEGSSRGKSWLSGPVHITKSVTINKSADELYHFWRNFENLPQFMTHLESVTKTGDKTSHWKAKAPLGSSVEWDAEITSDIEKQRIGWMSLEGSDIPNSGVVHFLPTTNRGTEVKVNMTYEPPAGMLGALVAKLLGEEPHQQVSEDLRRFKSLMETGLIIKTEGQPSGREEMPKARVASAR